MHGYDVPFSQYEVNDRNAVLRVQPLGAIQPSGSGSGLPGRFLLHDLHFHIGLDNTYGSEHTVDGKPFAMEDHFVHYNDQFRSFEEAVTEKGRPGRDFSPLQGGRVRTNAHSGL
nr:carbonic anhydrase 3-like [Dermacentor andersoni]